VKNPPPGYGRVTPYLLYEDLDGAIAHLRETYGFEERHSAVGAAGRKHAELELGGDALVMAGQASQSFKSARTLGVMPSAMIHLYVDDVEALHERARAAGAEIPDLELAQNGDKRFTAEDPEGQLWVFAQRVS
jgi:PhnB protein